MPRSGLRAASARRDRAARRRVGCAVLEDARVGAVRLYIVDVDVQRTSHDRAQRRAERSRSFPCSSDVQARDAGRSLTGSPRTPSIVSRMECLVGNSVRHGAVVRKLGGGVGVVY